MVGVGQEITSLLCGGRVQFALSKVDQREIGQLGLQVHIPARTTAFIQGEPTVAVYRLTQGTAVLYKRAANGRKQVLGFKLPGDFLNSPFTGQHSCSADAISHVVACQLPRQQFLDFLKARPAILSQMLEATLEETDAVREHMFLLGRGTAEEKLVEFIVGWRARIRRKGALANLVSLPMSRRDIADYLGLTIETVSRLLAKLERESVLRVVPEGLLLVGSIERPVIFERSYRVAALNRSTTGSKAIPARLTR